MRHELKIVFIFGIAMAAIAANAQAVDTSEWVCEFCPFDDSYRGDYQVGATNVSDDSAYFGDATGYDEEGVYANLSGDGSFSSDSHRVHWTLEDLGLDSRYAALAGGQPGKFDYSLSYREIPRRQYYDTSTIFNASGNTLSLPSGWVRAPQTTGFSSLSSSSARRAIESDRSTLAIRGRYLPFDRLSVTAEYRQRQHDGVKIQAGSSFTTASLFPMPFDYTTDEVDIGLRYRGDNSFVSLRWYLSDFESSSLATIWENPFTAAAGAETSALAQAPDNRFQSLAIAAGYSFPDFQTVINVSAALGNIEQNAAFLDYTTNGNIAVAALPRTLLNGDIDTTNFAASLSSRPFDKARIQFSYRYDERDNKTAQGTWDRVITDTFISGDLEQNIPYSFERTKLSLSGDYDLFTKLRVSGGYERKELDRSFQEVAEQTEDTGWARLRWRPLTTLEIDLRGGTSKRDIDAYNETFAADLGQNPLLRKYNLAYRYRQFGELRLVWSPLGAPISVALNGLYADDEYTRSQLGLTAGDELSVAADVNWSISETATIYINAGIDEINSKQAGSELFALPDWRATFDDDFTTLSAGVRIRRIAEKVDLQFDVTRSDGESAINVVSDAEGSDPFPDLTSELSFVRLRLTYHQSARTQFSLNVRYQGFDTEDWALQGVQPDTITSVLSLGARPFDDDTLIAGFTVRLSLGSD